ncbi:hypothetical protein GH714_013650 [Hevea brasiliensis]|uniref:Ferritin n=1 Tax=Hevea brasiliensis TaxID=3981 RepID=A0A6A6MZ08_HEVBR|nr:hypothetical protein GH714_013650 [Hevea brasiliensis]
MLLKASPAFSLLSTSGDNLGPLFSSVSSSSISLSPSTLRGKVGTGFVVCASKGGNDKPLTGVFLSPLKSVEYNVSYVYHAMFAYFDRDNVALKGLAKFFKESSLEEREHAEKLMEYQNKRGGKVKLQSIVMPLSEFDHAEKGDALYAMELALSLEKLTNEKLLNLHSVAEQNHDAQLTDFIESEFLAEQVEAIKKISEYVAQLRRVGKGHVASSCTGKGRVRRQLKYGRYGAVKDVGCVSLEKSSIHEGCTPIHLNLVVPRASASAVAFGMGLFSRREALDQGIIELLQSAVKAVQDFRKSQEPGVDKLKEPILDEITAAIVSRYELNFTRQDTASLWFLCKQGYGKSINYRMGVPLLEDVVHSMEEAIKAQEEQLAPGSYEKARLRFAHAETVVPFTCLLGLFLEQSGDALSVESSYYDGNLCINAMYKIICIVTCPCGLLLYAKFLVICGILQNSRKTKGTTFGTSSRPPHSRNWWGSTIAPFAGNNMLVLHSCPANPSSKYFIEVLHNEHPIPMPVAIILISVHLKSLRYSFINFRTCLVHGME